MDLSVDKKLWNKDFLLLWQGAIYSNLGSVIYSASIGIWVYNKTGSTALMGIMSSISFAILIVFSPFAGAVSDRSSRKFLLILTDCINIVIMVTVAILAMQDQLSTVIVLIAAVVCALAGVLFTPAANTSYADIVSAKDLPRAQSLASGAKSIADMLGRGISGIVVLNFGIGPVILIIALLYSLSAFIKLFINIPKGVKQGSDISVSNLFRDLGLGIKEIFSNKVLAVLVGVSLSANLLATGMNHLLLPFCLGKGFTAEQFSYLVVMESVGALCGVFFVGLIPFKHHQRYHILMLGFAISTFCEMMTCILGSFTLVNIFHMLAQVTGAAGNMMYGATLLLLIPVDKRGVVSGFVTMVSSSGAAISILLYGFLGESIPIHYIGLVGQTLTGLTLLPLWLIKECRETMKRDPAEHPSYRTDQVNS